MSGRLQASGLICGYGPCAILDPLDLQVQPGEVLALIGPNGVGKTTLLHTLAGLIKPMGGDILLDGTSLQQVGARSRARLVALAPQRAGQSSWPLNVKDSVSLGRAPHRGWLMPLTPEDREVIHWAMVRMGIEHLAHRSLSTLSGGEVRRVILARALCQQPKVMLLDEPTTYLDLRYQSELLGIVKELARKEGMALIITVHDLVLAALCADRIALLGQRRLQAFGPPEEVLQESVLKPIYGEHLEVLRHPASQVPLVLPVAAPIKGHDLPSTHR